MNHKIKRGYNIPLHGKVEQRVANSTPTVFTVHPSHYKNVKGKLQVKEGDTVKIGTPLFFDKKNTAAIFASPASGKVTQIKFGPRRIVESIVIEEAGSDSIKHKSFTAESISKIDRTQLLELLSKAGMVPFLRQRPFDSIISTEDTPSSIFVNCMDTAPLAIDPEFMYKDDLEAYNLAVGAMQVLSGGKVHIVTNAENKDSLFSKVTGTNIEQHSFSGKHPAGLVGTHIEKIDPITGHGKLVWYVNLECAVQIGKFLSTGTYPTLKKVAVAGEGASENIVYQTRQGAQVKLYCKSKSEEQRLVSGDVLTGKKITEEDSIKIYENLLSVIPESTQEHFIGWMLPGFSKPTFSRTYLSALIPGRKRKHNTNRRGEERALVKTGDYRMVVGLDIYPAELVKAILSEDIELMEQLGILEVTPEDVALCSYICPSKVEFTEIIQSGIDMMLSELD